MSDDATPADLLAELTRRLALLNHDKLRLLDQVAQRVEAGQATDFGDDLIGAGLSAVALSIRYEDEARAEAREVTRDEMVPRQPRAFRPDDRGGMVQIGLPGDNVSLDPMEFAVDQHLTRVDATPEVIALCELPRERDERREVDLEFDTSELDPQDSDAPIGPLVPEYDFEGGGTE